MATCNFQTLQQIENIDQLTRQTSSPPSGIVAALESHLITELQVDYLNSNDREYLFISLQLCYKLWNRCSSKFRHIHRKTSVFNKVAGLQACYSFLLLYCYSFLLLSAHMEMVCLRTLNDGKWKAFWIGELSVTLKKLKKIQNISFEITEYFKYIETTCKVAIIRSINNGNVPGFITK